MLYVLGVTRVNDYRVNMQGLKELRVRIYWIRDYREEVISDIWYEGYKNFKGWVLDIVKDI